MLLDFPLDAELPDAGVVPAAVAVAADAGVDPAPVTVLADAAVVADGDAVLADAGVVPAAFVPGVLLFELVGSSKS